MAERMTFPQRRLDPTLEPTPARRDFSPFLCQPDRRQRILLQQLATCHGLLVVLDGHLASDPKPVIFWPVLATPRVVRSSLCFLQLH